MFPLSHPMTCAGLAAALLAVSVAVHAQPATDASAQIRRTSFGVPHIVAKDERGLGYGVGYAYAQDNLCLLANEVLTVSGERSRHFGANGKTLEQRDNLASDVFFTWLNSPVAVDTFLQAQRRRCKHCWRVMPAATTGRWPSAAAGGYPPNAVTVSGCDRSPARTWSS